MGEEFWEGRGAEEKGLVSAPPLRTWGFLHLTPDPNAWAALGAPDTQSLLESLGKTREDPGSSESGAITEMSWRLGVHLTAMPGPLLRARLSPMPTPSSQLSPHYYPCPAWVAMGS